MVMAQVVKRFQMKSMQSREMVEERKRNYKILS